MTPAAKGLLDESTSDAIVFSEGQHCEGKFNSLSLTAANGSILLVSEYILSVSPHILGRLILLTNVPMVLYKVAMAEITSNRPFFRFSNVRKNNLLPYISVNVKGDNQSCPERP